MSIIMDLHLKFREIDKREQNRSVDRNNSSGSTTVGADVGSGKSSAVGTSATSAIQFNPDDVNDRLGIGDISALDDFTKNKIPFTIVEHDDGTLIQYSYNGVKYTVICYVESTVDEATCAGSDFATIGTDSVTGSPQPAAGAGANSSDASDEFDNIVDAYIDYALNDIKTNYADYGFTTTPSSVVLKKLETSIKNECSIDNVDNLYYEDVEAKVNSLAQRMVMEILGKGESKGDFATYEEFRDYVKNGARADLAKLGLSSDAGSYYECDIHKDDYVSMTKLDVLTEFYKDYLKCNTPIMISDDMVSDVEYSLNDIGNAHSWEWVGFKRVDANILTTEQINQFFVEKTKEGETYYSINYKAVLEAFYLASKKEPDVEYQLPGKMAAHLDEISPEDMIYDLVKYLSFCGHDDAELNVLKKDQIPALPDKTEPKVYSSKVNTVLQLEDIEIGEILADITFDFQGKLPRTLREMKDFIVDKLKEHLLGKLDKQSYIKYNGIIDKLVNNAYLGQVAGAGDKEYASTHDTMRNFIMVISEFVYLLKNSQNPDLMLDRALNAPWTFYSASTGEYNEHRMSLKTLDGYSGKTEDEIRRAEELRGLTQWLEGSVLVCWSFDRAVGIYDK